MYTALAESESQYGWRRPQWRNQKWRWRRVKTWDGDDAKVMKGDDRRRGWHIDKKQCSPAVAITDYTVIISDGLQRVDIRSQLRNKKANRNKDWRPVPGRTQRWWRMRASGSEEKTFWNYEGLRRQGRRLLEHDKNKISALKRERWACDRNAGMQSRGSGERAVLARVHPGYHYYTPQGRFPE